jgi:two-component system sensor histidine kinase YesM
MNKKSHTNKSNKSFIISIFDFINSNTHSIQEKLQRDLIVTISLILIILGLFVVFNIERILYRNTKKDVEFQITDFLNIFDEVNSQIGITADYIITDDEMQQFYNIDYDATLFEKNNARYDCGVLLSRYPAINHYISSIVIKTDANLYYSTLGYDQDYLKKNTDEFLENNPIQSLNRNTIYHHHFFKGNKNTEIDIFTYAYKFHPLNNLERTDILFINLDIDTILNLVPKGNEVMESMELIKDGKVLFSINNENNILQFNQPLPSIQNNDKLFVTGPNKAGWKTIVHLSQKHVILQALPILCLFILAIIISVISIIIIVIPVIRNITQPVEEMSNAMKEVSNSDYSIRLREFKDDEMKELGHGFNYMTSKISDQIVKIKEQTDTRRKLELELLMHQINPHFIYNTLNSIVYCVHLKNPEGVETIAKSLIHILQNSVRIGENILVDTIRIELSIIENYMNIQNYRYPDKFDYKVECNNNLLDCIIPKMILQPLVENALFHGVQLIEGRGKIKILIKKDDINNTIVIQVIDNGVGMDFKALDTCFTPKDQHRNTNKSYKIGLSNIKQRIAYLYKGKGSLKVESKQNIGTDITIILPYNKLIY